MNRRVSQAGKKGLRRTKTVYRVELTFTGKCGNLAGALGGRSVVEISIDF